MPNRSPSSGPLQRDKFAQQQLARRPQSKPFPGEMWVGAQAQGWHLLQPQGRAGSQVAGTCPDAGGSDVSWQRWAPVHATFLPAWAPSDCVTPCWSLWPRGSAQATEHHCDLSPETLQLWEAASPPLLWTSPLCFGKAQRRNQGRVHTQVVGWRWHECGGSGAMSELSGYVLSVPATPHHQAVLLEEQ